MNISRILMYSGFLIASLLIIAVFPNSVEAASDETQVVASADQTTSAFHSQNSSTEFSGSGKANESTTKTVNELAVPTRPDRNGAGQNPNSIHGKSQLMDVGVKLGIVVGVFLIVMILMSKKSDSSSIPKEAIEVLGRVPFTGKQALQLVRFGQKLVLVESSANGLKPISEMTDPVEVQNMLHTINSKRR